MRALTVLAVLAVASLCPPSTANALNQPNGASVPSDIGCHANNPTGLAATFACICDGGGGQCNIGASCPGSADPSSCDLGQNNNCETTLWHNWNDNPCVPSNISGLDPWTEASTDPQTFAPTCALTFTVVSRGTAIFKDVFGWYNVTGSRPAPEDLHVMLDCNSAVGTEVSLDVRSHPDYAGGEIGFFLISPEDRNNRGNCAPGTDCCASIANLQSDKGYVYYSERQFNPDANGGDSYIHLLVYDSRITSQKFYFAWEDIYGGDNNDFTDLVTSVSGVECSGGGVSCDTGAPGLCSHGITSCRGASLECVQLREPESETCDGVDDDCDDKIDEDATCPDGGVCDNGRCLPSCELGEEFACPTFATCDSATGLCVDPLCVGVTCPPGSVCRGGECVAECDDITCPVGTTCRKGECVDPCRNVQCAGGEVCREGICFPGCTSCAGVSCQNGDVCQLDSGECMDSSCPGGCPAGTYCDSGSCIDSCTDAVCPAGQICVGGDCCAPEMCPTGPSGDPDAGPGGGGPSPSSGCGCRSSSGDGSTAFLLGMALILGLLRRRRACA